MNLSSILERTLSAEDRDALAAANDRYMYFVGVYTDHPVVDHRSEDRAAFAHLLVFTDDGRPSLSDGAAQSSCRLSPACRASGVRHGKNRTLSANTVRGSSTGSGVARKAIDLPWTEDGLQPEGFARRWYGLIAGRLSWHSRKLRGNLAQLEPATLSLRLTFFLVE